MKKHFMLAAVLLLTLTGCQNIQSWSYKPEVRRSGQPILNRSVVVLPLEDRRENVNRNRLAMYLIPLMPFGWADYQTPEGVPMHVFSGQWQFRPVDDMARAITLEIENARVFQETFYGTRASEGDFVLSGKLVATGYKGKLITYGLSVYGPLLWIIGLPAGTASNELVIELSLSRSLSDPPLWTHEIREQAGGVSWLYAMKSDFRYADLLKQGMSGAIDSLSDAARRLE